MRIGFLIGDLDRERPHHTTIYLAKEAANLGHEVSLIPYDGITCGPSNRITARAFRPGSASFASPDEFLDDVRSPGRQVARADLQELDLLLLRHDPYEDPALPSWGPLVAITFGRLLRDSGVVVLNDPDGLAKAQTKLYLQHFPADVRPEAMISRDPGEIFEFSEVMGGPVVIKPIQASAGRGVFLLDHRDRKNRNQMIDAVCRDGYALVQAYVPAAAEGTMRLYMVGGEPLQVRGRYAALALVPRGGDLRSNAHAGGEVRRAVVGEDVLRVARRIGPKLVEDGIFIAGVDLAGDKVLELNTFCPGGLRGIQRFEEVPFARAIVEAAVEHAGARAARGRA